MPVPLCQFSYNVRVKKHKNQQISWNKAQENAVTCRGSLKLEVDPGKLELKEVKDELVMVDAR